MKKPSERIVPNEAPLTKAEFMESYNKNMPEGYPLVSLTLLDKFKEAHSSLFKAPNIWTLEQHRKRMIEWLPQNI